MLSLVTFVQLMFLGFAGSFVAEVIKSRQDDAILFWSSFFSLILAIVILYIYIDIFSKTKS